MCELPIMTQKFRIGFVPVFLMYADDPVQHRIGAHNYQLLTETMERMAAIDGDSTEYRYTQTLCELLAKLPDAIQPTPINHDVGELGEQLEQALLALLTLFNKLTRTSDIGTLSDWICDAHAKREEKLIQRLTTTGSTNYESP